MATKAAEPPVVEITAPGQPVPMPPQGQSVPAPDPRKTASSSKMPHVPISEKTNSSLSTITAALGYSAFQPVTFASSTFKPSFVLLSLILSHLDRIMINTYRFGQSNPDWHPMMSQIYYGILFVVHIIKVKQANQTITPNEYQFISWFETIFPLSSLPIAGPLKHFFQAITASSGPTKYYGNIGPVLPPNWVTTAANNFVFNAPEYANTLPPIRVMMDFLNDALTSGTRANFNVNDPIHWQQYFVPYTHLHSAPIADEQIFGLPGMTDIVYLAAQQMPSWHMHASGIPFPPRLAANTPPLTSIAEYLGFANNGAQHYAWFPVVVGMMQRHAQFFKESTSLASISHVGLGASLPIVAHAANANISLVNSAANQVIHPIAAVAATPAAPNVPATPGHAAGFQATPFLNLNITSASKSDDIHLLAEQFAMLADVNPSYTGLAARGGHYIGLPADNVLRHGPYWDLPDIRVHAQIDVLTQIKTFLTGTFHTDTRMS
jgi:hypothetical protein